MIFYYAARSRDGSIVRGAIEADSRQTAAGHLRARSLFVTALESTASAKGSLAWMAAGLRRNAAARATFFRCFATLAGAGISVARALDALAAECSDAALAETLRSICADVETGSALSTAMSRHPDDFSTVAIAMIAAGEAGGSLDEALRSVAEMEERDGALRKRVGAALAYPIVVTAAALLLVMFLVAETLPAFASVFAQMNVTVPWTTRALIAAGMALQKPYPWAAFAAASVAVVVALRAYKGSDAPWAFALDRLRLGLPLLGPIATKSTMARFSRTLGSLLKSGVEIVRALETAGRVVDGPIHRNGLRGVVEALRRGESLIVPLEATGLFDATFLQLVRAGEESGGLEAMLLRLSHHYELDVETSVAALTSVLEPLLICFLGAAIGTIVASVIVPLYSMIGNVK